MRLWELFSTDTEFLGEEGRIVAGVNTTKDVQPGETQRQAAKFGNILDANGLPPLITGGRDTKSEEFSGASEFYGKDGTNLHESVLDEIHNIEPFNAGTDDANRSRLKIFTQNGLPKQVGKIKDWTIHCDDWPDTVAEMPRFIFANQQGEPMGSARLGMVELGSDRFKVGHIWINPMFQKRGYGYDFYCWLLDQGVTLDADHDQTQGSQAMWKKLAQNYDVRITKDDWQSGRTQDISAVYSDDGRSLGLRARKA